MLVNEQEEGAQRLQRQILWKQGADLRTNITPDCVDRELVIGGHAIEGYTMLRDGASLEGMMENASS